MKKVAESEIAQTIDTAGDKTGYDAAAKKLVAQKAILAYILKGTIDELKDVTVEQIAEECIEGTPKVSEIAVHQDTRNASDVPDDSGVSDISDTPDTPGTSPAGEKQLDGSNRVPKVSAEDNSVLEGSVRYDIHFTVRVPEKKTGEDKENSTGGEQIQIIVNVEAQNSDRPGYPIVKRGIYYVARLISAQRNQVFKDQEYGKIGKVVSIWICKNTAEKRSDTMNEYRFEEICRRGEYREEEENYDLMRVFILRLGAEGENSENEVIRLLSNLFSTEKTAEEKKQILSEDFHIAMTEEIDEEVSSMCNLSEGIFEEGMAKGMEAGMAKGRTEGLEQGRAEGIELGRLEAAKELLASGLDEEMIMKSLKLSADQIRALKES